MNGERLKKMKKKILNGLLKGVAGLPLPLLYLFSDFVYFVLYHVIGYRKKVVRENLKSSFPEKDAKELKRIEKEYYHFLGDVMVETVKLACISDKELRKRVEVRNPEVVNEAVEREGKNVVLLLGHYGNWEWVQEISRYFSDKAYQGSIYHPLNDKLWDEIYLGLRSRWGAHIVPQRNAVRVLLDRDHFPWIFGFIADARPMESLKDNHTMFLNHDTRFIYGPETIGNKTKAAFFYLEMEKTGRGRYAITFHPLEGLDDGKPYPVSRQFWKEFEKTVRRAPGLWLWSHKRWK